MLLALVEKPAREMTRHCREALESESPADVKLRSALHAYADALQNYPELFWLFSEGQPIAAIPGADGIIENAAECTRTLLAIVEEGVDAGVFRSDLDPRLVMHGDVFAKMIFSGLRP